MALVKSLNYASNKPISASGKPEILRFRSDNSTYNSGDVIRIEIPTGRQGQHLFPQDSYIEAKVSVQWTNGTTATNVYLDGCAYSFFRRLRVLHGSNVIEDTLYSNRLWNAIYDVQRNASERRGDSINMLIYPPLYDNAANLGTFGLYGYGIPTTVTAGTYNSDARDFTFILPSALLGCLAQKSLPLSLCGASSIYLELELESATQVFYGATSGGNGVTAIKSFTLSDIYYNAKVVQLPYDIEKLVIESTDGIINLPCTAYKGELKTIPSYQSSFNDKFSFQHSSVKNFLFFMQNSVTANGAAGSLSITQRPRMNLTEWNLMINGEAYPSQPINTLSKMYTELMRSYDMLTDAKAGGILEYNLYNAPNAGNVGDQAAGDVLATIVFKRFVAGLDLDRFNHSSDTLMSGLNCVGNTISLNLLLSTLGNANLYAFIQYDLNIKLQGGLLQALY